MIAYRAMLDVPRELVSMLAGLLRAERRRRGTRAKTRALTCWYQAILVLAWYRRREDIALLGAGFTISRATSYRYLAEGVTVLAAEAPDLHEALQRVAEEGWSHVILDGKLFGTDRVAATTTGTKGTTIHAWYSGKHHGFGGNIQAVMRPDGLPIWTSAVTEGHTHDLTAARDHHILGALYWAASRLHLPTLADGGYEGAGRGVHTPVGKPGDGQALGADNQTYNALLRGARARGERGFALLVGRWRALHHITAGPGRISDIVHAALVLTQFEHRYLRTSC
ncbi:transposase family protein [Pseudonocardia asaccharolytica]|uniref:Transposase n=1 Tax=Pseudonocardia asaccharolytica DSM 44247 = NBRC 16224 TaxID=1123024 RepID=A0A511D215_9PSEU|nr:transposase family protein [Pseudonocardia asaccharolytica]GEL18819.1 transposase [Pseudonocardia asaccharolytica DSM 44247 = NBRC 16224]